MILGWGLHGFFIALIAQTALATLLLPTIRLRTDVGGPAGHASLTPKALLLFGSTLGFFIATGGLWACVDSLGVDYGLTPGFIGYSLAGSMALGLAGAGLATVWTRRFPLEWAIAAGIVIAAVSPLLLEAPGAARFFAGVALINFTIMFTTPPLLARLAATEAREQAASLGMLGALIGTALGPSLCTAIIVGWGVTGLAAACMVLLLAALMLAMAAFRQRR